MDPVMIVLVCIIGALLVGVIAVMAKSGKKDAENQGVADRAEEEKGAVSSEDAKNAPVAEKEESAEENIAKEQIETRGVQSENAREESAAEDLTGARTENALSAAGEEGEKSAQSEVAAAAISAGTDRAASAQNGEKFPLIPKGEPKKPFYERIVAAEEENIRIFFNEIHNEFKSYRAITARVSKGYDSFRKNRKLIARLYLSGKTFKLYLKLNAGEYENSKYHQQYAGDKKTYAEIPMLVKIKSGRGLANAKTLIADLMKNEGAEKKTRYRKINYIETLKALMEND